MATRNQRSNRSTNGNRRQSPQDERTYKIVYGVVERGEQNFWTRIGAAFENRDGSLNLVLDFVPMSADTTIQLREPRDRDEE